MLFLSASYRLIRRSEAPRRTAAVRKGGDGDGERGGDTVHGPPGALSTDRLKQTCR